MTDSDRHTYLEQPDASKRPTVKGTVAGGFWNECWEDAEGTKPAVVGGPVGKMRVTMTEDEERAFFGHTLNAGRNAKREEKERAQ